MSEWKGEVGGLTYEFEYVLSVILLTLFFSLLYLPYLLLNQRRTCLMTPRHYIMKACLVRLPMSFQYLSDPTNASLGGTATSNMFVYARRSSLSSSSIALNS